MIMSQVLKKAAIVQKAKTAEHTRTERQVLEHIRQSPFLVTLHYAFQTQTKLHLILGERRIKQTHTWNSLAMTLEVLKVCLCVCILCFCLCMCCCLSIQVLSVSVCV